MITVVHDSSMNLKSVHNVFLIVLIRVSVYLDFKERKLIETEICFCACNIGLQVRKEQHADYVFLIVYAKVYLNVGLQRTQR